ncbi:NAD(P)-binding protein [Hypoxylon crocopeplum]|nr:NAD(P)-binding protein [Hypoxylon crocopeplum]
MANSTVVLITGVGRDLRNRLAAAYLLRPNHIVIENVRDAKAPKAQELTNLSIAEGSRLVLVSIENTSHHRCEKAAEDIEAAGLEHIDIIISNTAVPPSLALLDIVDAEVMVKAFSINAVSCITIPGGVQVARQVDRAQVDLRLEPSRFHRFVQTDMEMEAARLGGIDKPPTTAHESTAKIIEVIDAATLENTTGNLIDLIIGEEYP